MVKLTCLLRRKEGLTPAEFHAHWKDVHGPLVANSRIPQQDRRVANTAVGSMAAANTTASKSNETASGYKGGGASAPSPFRYANSLKIAVRRPRILSCNKTCSKSIFSE